MTDTADDTVATGEVAIWDPTAPLARGVTLIEASAGTGKTYNITNLVVRLVAEAGIGVDRILVVTYTRAATAELKDRIRGRLVEALDSLQADEAPGDPVLARLRGSDPADPDPAVVARSARRLRDALEGFDQALISTIHGFCQRMLQQNAFESGVAFDLELAPDTGDLLDELVDDHLASVYYDADADRARFLRGACGFTRDALKKLVKAALDDPDTAVFPIEAPDPSEWPGRVAAFAAEWPALADHLVAYLAGEVAAAKAGEPSVVTKGQRTFGGAKDRAWVDGVTDWLASDPPFGSLPPDSDRFDPHKCKKQLADAAVGFDHPALERLTALCAFPEAVAGGMRAALVANVREAFEARKERRRLQTYQDLLRGLARRLAPEADPDDRTALVRAIGDTFDAALIDEFQDTDDHQWTIFEAVFGGGDHHLYLIGDPKQAIYGFRGANVHVYGAATEQAGRRYTMAVNWRSDRRLLGALNHLLDRPGTFGGVPFGYVAVDAPDGRGADGIRAPGGLGAPEHAPLQLRWFDHALLDDEPPKEEDGPPKPLAKGRLAGPLAARVAEDVVALLGSGVELRDEAHGSDGWRPIRPGDVALLVASHRQAAALQEALAEAGVPAVRTGAASVMASDEALEVQRWLGALVEHAGSSAARLAASTRMFGWTAAELLGVEREEPALVARWDGWLARLAEWREILFKRGFMRAFRRALDQQGVRQRLLGLDDGERRVTNLLHVAELVHAAETRQRLRLGALHAWLVQRRSDDDLDADVAELRLDRDAEAAHILTMHKSKGLEFPVCFVPYLWDGGRTVPKADEPLVVPHPDAPTRRLLDVGVPPSPASLASREQENKEERLRLAYVALTRGKHRTVVYAGHGKDYEHSPLAALLHGGGRDRIGSGQRRVEGGTGLADDLDAIAASSGGRDGLPRIGVVRCAPPTGQRWDEPPKPPLALATRTFHRPALDPGWRRHSYTSLTRAAGHAVLDGDLVEDGREGFDADATDAPVAAPAAPSEEEVPLAAFPAGAEAGTLLHEIFEHADFTAVAEASVAAPAPEPTTPPASEPQLSLLDAVAAVRSEEGSTDEPASDDVPVGYAALEPVIRERLEIHGFDGARWTELLARGLGAVLRTPLGGALGDLRLCDVPTGERLDEMRFDLPITCGSRSVPARVGSDGDGAPDDLTAPARGLVAALRQRDDGSLPADWLASLDRLDRVQLAGFLTGSIDLVFRAPCPDGARRWFVVDYKSNRLDPGRTGRCLPEAFARAGMAAEMARHDYFLQYHLYLVALHRFLSWRVPDYDYDRDVGGVYYLFFRGMLGPETAREPGRSEAAGLLDAGGAGDAVRGCYFDRPPREVVLALDAALRGPTGGAR